MTDLLIYFFTASLTDVNSSISVETLERFAFIYPKELQPTKSD